MSRDNAIQLIVSEAKTLAPKIIAMRRDFHKHPELGFQETRTSGIVESELSSLGFSTLHCAKTGIIGLHTHGTPDRFIGLRADMDALALTEENSCEYASVNHGIMHACGHDAHTAMLLGAASIISKHKALFPGNIKFIFQPAEEGGGGGKKIVDEGHIDNVTDLIGIHVWGSLPPGQIRFRKGPFFASANGIKISIHGCGGHAAYPNHSIDPTSVGADIYNAIHKLVSREISPFSPCVISLTQMQGSEANNIIPERMILRGTIRTFDNTLQEYIINRIQEIVSSYSKAWRCTGSFETEGISYPVLFNNPELVQKCNAMALEISEIQEAEQTLGGEDFAFYAQKCRSAMYLLGVEKKNNGITYAHHHPQFDIDESVLYKGAALYALSAYECVQNTK